VYLKIGGKVLYRLVDIESFEARHIHATPLKLVEDDLRQTVDELDDDRHAENLSYGLPHMFCPDDAFHLREAHAQELQDRARYWDRALAIEHTGWTEAELKSRRNQGRLLELSAPATTTTPHRKAYPAEQFMPGFDAELFRLLNWLASRSCSEWATHQYLSGWTTQNKQGEVINGWSVLGLPDAPVNHEPLTDPVFTGVGNRPALMRPVYAPAVAFSQKVRAAAMTRGAATGNLTPSMTGAMSQ
jgi:hypothetical protein